MLEPSRIKTPKRAYVKDHWDFKKQNKKGLLENFLLAWIPFSGGCKYRKISNSNFIEK